MQKFKMMAGATEAEVEVAYAAQFKWKNGTIEYMFDPDRDWELFGISAKNRDKIKAAIEEHRMLDQGKEID